MRIEPWFPQTLAPSLSPETKVYTMRLTSFCGEEIAPQLCDQCWTSEAERSRHFWYSDRDMRPEGKTPISMTLGEYIDMHVREIKPMNPFQGLARVEFLAKWRTREG